MVFSISNLPAQSAAQNIERASRPSHQGQLGKVRVRKLPNPTQMIEDLQEELSSAHSEHLESKKIESQNEDESLTEIYEQLVQQIEEKYPAQEEPQKEHLKEFLAYVQEQNPKNSDQIKQFLSSLTEDKAEAFALIAVAMKDSHFNTPTKTLLQGIATTFVRENKTAIQAGLNTIDVSKKLSPALNQESAQLQANYQAVVNSYAGILPILTGLAKNKQLGKFDAMSNFLMQAAAKDLASQQTSTQPKRLLHILAAFQGVKIFHTISDWSNKAYQRLKSKMTEAPPLTQQDLLHNVLQYIAKPENFNSEIKLPLRNLLPSDRVLVFQDLRAGVRELPNYLFNAGEADKSRALFPLQNEIDKLVFEQDA